MLGAIIGDVVGSRFEFNNLRSKKFDLVTKESCITDDSILTIAIADCINKGLISNEEIVENVKRIARPYPNCGWGGRFGNWLYSDNDRPYHSAGNGSAMRISPVGWCNEDALSIEIMSRRYTDITHNSFEGEKGAECVAMCILLARNKTSKSLIKKIVETFYYKLDFDYKDLVQNYKFSELCQDSVPQAIYCFLISNSFEDCLRTTISIGGDSDTLCAISCAIAEAYYDDIPKDLIIDVFKRVPKDLRDIVIKFCKKHNKKYLKLLTSIE